MKNAKSNLGGFVSAKLQAKMRSILVIALVAVIGFGLTTCGGDEGGEGTPPISAFAGTWNASNGRVIFIDGTFLKYLVLCDEVYSGFFSVSGSSITFDITNTTGIGSVSGKYTLSGNKLVLSGITEDKTVNGTYTKVGDGGDNVLLTILSEESSNWTEQEDWSRWQYNYRDPNHPFDFADMYAKNKAYLFTFSFVSDLDIDDIAFRLTEQYEDSDGGHWNEASDWIWIAENKKRNTRNSGSVYIIPNAHAANTQADRTYIQFYFYNRDVNVPVTLKFYQFSLDQVEIATLNSLAANGSTSSTTTQLTLTFSKAITGLSASDITLSGVAGVTKGTLSGSGTTYTLPISGFTKGGTLNIAAEKSGYVFKNWLQTATIYYKNNGSGNGNGGPFNNLNDFKDWLNGLPNNTKDNPYNAKLNFNNLTDLLNFLKGLSGKYINLDLSDSNLTGIGADAFNGLGNLTGITLPNGITSIGANAFKGCSNLTSITLPGSVNSIGANAFQGCTNLIIVIFNGPIPSGSFDVGAFSGLGDLRDKYLAGGTGTYTRPSGGTTWTRQSGGTDTASFAGTWNASGNRSIIFSGSTFNYKVNGSTTYSGTFSVSGSTITFNATGLGTASGNFSLSGTTLTLSNHTWDSSVNGTYTKDGGSSGNIAVTGVTLNKTAVTLTVGGTEALTATVAPSNATNKEVTWSSSNDSIASVENGVVTAVAQGTATITAKTTDGNKIATCTVTVNSAISWQNLTANGTANTVDTTELTLTFDKDPVGLAIGNITVTGATKGTLTGTGATRTLTISNITVAQGANVTVALTNPSGYTITPSSKTVAINKFNITWTAVTDGTFDTSAVNAVAYGADKFVAVGDGGKIAYSSDGVTWTAVTNSTFSSSYYLRDIVYGADKFVAVGYSIGSGANGRMAYSTDGVTWTAVTGSISGISIIGTWSIDAVTYGAGKFVIVGSFGTAYSTNGISWTSGGSTNSSSSIFKLAYGNNIFVVTNGNAGRLAYSSDGITWTNVTNSTFSTNSVNYVCSIAYGNNKFVAGDYYGKMAYSTNGSSWTAVSNSTFSTTPINAIAYGYNKYVAGSKGSMAFSADGVAWTAVSNSTFGTSAVNGIAYGGGKFVAVGDGGKIAYSNAQE